MIKENKFDKYLGKKKAELRKLKDSDFVTTSFDIPSPIVKAINREMDVLSKRHEMDTMEVSAASVSHGLEAIEKITENNGEGYTKNILLELSDAIEKGDVKKIAMITNQMEIDAECKTDLRQNEDDEDLSLEQYIRKYHDRLEKESYKEEDFILINARNPEDPEDIIELHPHKTQVEEFKAMSSDLDIPVEELAFITFMCAIEQLEETPLESKQEIKSLLDRQAKRIHDNLYKKTRNILEEITIGELKNKLKELYSIPTHKLDAIERSWKKEFRTNKLSGQYEDIETYVKMKFVSMLKNGTEKDR